jgi:hypothetical protein
VLFWIYFFVSYADGWVGVLTPLTNIPRFEKLENTTKQAQAYIS